MCFDGSSFCFLRMSFTKDSFVSVSRVVPLFETRMKIVFEQSIEAVTEAASSGSTLEIKWASILNVLFAFAQFSSARYIARGPKSEPPIPIWQTVVYFSPFSFKIFPV